MSVDSAPVVPTYWWPAAADLARRDAILAPIIAAYPGEALEPHGDIFRTLARAVVGQQISVLAAERIWHRLVGEVGAVSPQSVIDVSAARLRACGLTRRKADSLVAAAHAAVDDDHDWSSWLMLDDEEMGARLTRLSGVGPWTAHMVLIFAAGRADILPTGDIGLRRVAGDLYGETGGVMDVAALTALAESWRPWRSVAVWYLWRSLDPVPVAY